MTLLHWLGSVFLSCFYCTVWDLGLLLYRYVKCIIKCILPVPCCKKCRRPGVQHLHRGNGWGLGQCCRRWSHSAPSYQADESSGSTVTGLYQCQEAARSICSGLCGPLCIVRRGTYPSTYWPFFFNWSICIMWVNVVVPARVTHNNTSLVFSHWFIFRIHICRELQFMYKAEECEAGNLFLLIIGPVCVCTAGEWRWI